jgi:hypothetical protein
VENGRTFGDGKLFMDSIQTTVWLVPAKPNSPFLFFFQALAFLKIHKWFYFRLQNTLDFKVSSIFDSNAPKQLKMLAILLYDEPHFRKMLSTKTF